MSLGIAVRAGGRSMAIVRPISAFLHTCPHIRQTPTCFREKTTRKLKRACCKLRWTGKVIEPQGNKNKNCAIRVQGIRLTGTTNLLIQAAAAISDPASIAYAFVRNVPEPGGTIPPEIPLRPPLHISEIACLFEKMSEPINRVYYACIAIEMQVRNPHLVKLGLRKLAH